MVNIGNFVKINSFIQLYQLVLLRFKSIEQFVPKDVIFFNFKSMGLTLNSLRL